MNDAARNVDACQLALLSSGIATDVRWRSYNQRTYSSSVSASTWDEGNDTNDTDTTNAPTEAEVIALLTHTGAGHMTYSGAWNQAQVIDTPSEPVVMRREISLDALLNPPDELLIEAANANLDNRCALDGT